MEIYIGKFNPPIFHPNVYSSGAICSSLLNEIKCGWSPSCTHKLLLLALQEMLHDPNPKPSAPNIEAYRLFKNDKREYKRRVLAQAKKYST